MTECDIFNLNKNCAIFYLTKNWYKCRLLSLTANLPHSLSDATMCDDTSQSKASCGYYPRLLFCLLTYISLYTTLRCRIETKFRIFSLACLTNVGSLLICVTAAVDITCRYRRMEKSSQRRPEIDESVFRPLEFQVDPGEGAVHFALLRARARRRVRPTRGESAQHVDVWWSK